MSYPKIIATKYYALVEVRANATDIPYDDMPVIFSGAINEGDSIDRPEGWRICVRKCNWPTDPNSGLGAINCVNGWEGINEGEPEILEF